MFGGDAGWGECGRQEHARARSVCVWCVCV